MMGPEILYSKWFGVKKPPPPKPVAPLPDEDSPEVLQSGRRRVRKMRTTGGRRGSLLTDEYSGEDLGSA